MKDFPMFTTEYGVAALVLREIPYRKTAYIRIHDSLSPTELLAECVDFCRVCGAERILATGHEVLEAYPIHSSLLEMRCQREFLPDTDAALWPVQQQTLEFWRKLYNKRMEGVDNAAWMTEKDAAQMLAKGDGYFVHRGETLLGIGRASGDEMPVVISCVPGGGRDVVLALNHAVSSDTVRLEVASTNKRAIGLYQKLGFFTTAERTRWYKIL